MKIACPSSYERHTNNCCPQVFDLEAHPELMETRLDRMEMMIQALLDRESGSHDGRLSTATYVESPSAQSKKLDSAAVGDIDSQGHHLRNANSEQHHAGRPGDVGHVAHIPFVEGVPGAGDRPHVDLPAHKSQ